MSNVGVDHPNLNVILCFLGKPDVEITTPCILFMHEDQSGPEQVRDLPVSTWNWNSDVVLLLAPAHPWIRL